MKTSSIWNYRSIVGKIVLGLVLAAMIGNMDAAPAFGKDKHKNKHDSGRYEHRGNGHDRYERRGNKHDRYEHRGRKLGHDRNRYVHDGRYYQHYGYWKPGYAPPPVIYAPLPPPVFYAPPPPMGISIFFPPIFIHP